MFASDQETIDTWIKDIRSAIKYYKWIQFLTKEREKIRDLKMIEHLEKILCAITFANPHDKLIEGRFSASF